MAVCYIRRENDIKPGSYDRVRVYAYGRPRLWEWRKEMRFITLLTRYSGPLPCFCVHCILYRLWIFIGPGKRGERIIQDSRKPISLGYSNL